MDFDRLVEEVGDLEAVLNSYLLKDGIRDAFIIQNPYLEDKISVYIESIKKVFPNFVFTQMDQGILVTRDAKIPIDLQNYAEVQLGNLLGYPCAGDIGIHRNFSLTIWATYKGNRYDVYGMICKERNNEKMANFVKKITSYINNLNKQIKNKIEIDVQVKKLYSID